MNEWVRFALVAFYPRVDDLPGLAELGVEDKIAALRRESTLLFWTGIVAAAVFFQLSPIVTLGIPLPAVWLTEDQLDRHAYKLATFPVYVIRQLVVLLKLMAGVFWGESKEIRAFIHLPAYGADPGTRQLGPGLPPPLVEPHRAPTEGLVQLGRREEAQGRGLRHHHDHAIGKELA